LGPDITENDLVPIVEKFLSDKAMAKEVRMGAMKNIHVLLKECGVETRVRFLPYIMQTSDTTQYDWRLKFVTASLIGHLSLLYDEQTVYSHFLPAFFKLSFDPVAKVSETAALCLPLLLESLASNPSL
jgi:hypothetical protein